MLNRSHLQQMIAAQNIWFGSSGETQTICTNTQNICMTAYLHSNGTKHRQKKPTKGLFEFIQILFVPAPVCHHIALGPLALIVISQRFRAPSHTGYIHERWRGGGAK